jgi:hypothetical protein
MTDQCAEVWLGDLVRALVALTSSGRRLDETEVAAIKQMLGMGTAPMVHHHPAPVVSPVQPDDVVPVHVQVDEEPQSEPPDGEVPPVKRPPRRELAPQTTGERTTTLAGLRRSYNDKETQPWQKVEPLPQADAEAIRKPLPFTPLLRPGAARGIVQTALSRPEPEGEIDLEAVVADLAAAHPIRVLPRLSCPTMRFGVQVLVDRSPESQPFQLDQQDLLREIRLIVGEQATSVWYFNGSPRTGESARGDKFYQPIQGGRALVVSSFGIASGAEWYSDPDEWSAMADLWRRRGTVPVAMVPFPRSRFPRWLTALMPVVAWDRGTTVGTVRSALAAGAR